MSWTYLQPRHSVVLASPDPTATTFALEAGTGSQFIEGFATIGGNQCQIASVDGDTITLRSPVHGYIPEANDEVVQIIVGDKDKVRLYCGDTDSDDQQLTDEEIAVFLSVKHNILRAASLACTAIASKLARKVNYQIFQEIREDLSDQATAYREQAAALRREAARTTAVPFQGGLLQADKDIAVEDARLVKPFFTRGMMSEPGTQITEDTTAFSQRAL